MPRGGSKKGEHRGSAKRKAKQGAVGRAWSRKGVPNKRMAEIENEIDRITLMALTEPGDPAAVTAMFPKEQMLIAMQDMMHRYLQAKDTEAFFKAVSPPTSESVRLAVMCEERAIRFLTMATDFAFKAAPYLHPRLAAIAVLPQENDNPRGIVQAMLDEIDRRSREAKMINGSGQAA